MVYGLTDPSQVQVLGPERFRFSLRPLRFLSLQIQPTADLRVWNSEPGEVRIQSLDCWLEGAEHLNQHFSLAMEGDLTVHRQAKQVSVRGQAHLRVTLDLPPPFSLTPKPILEGTGNALLKSILSTIQRRLKRQLIQDYQAWADCLRAASIRMT